MKINKIQLNKIDFKNLLIKIIIHLKIATSIIVILLIVFTFSFLYKYLYRTITSAQQIIMLENELISEAINVDLLEKNSEDLAKKLNLPQRDFAKFNNLFSKTNTQPSVNNNIDNFSPRSSF